MTGGDALAGDREKGGDGAVAAARSDGAKLGRKLGDGGVALPPNNRGRQSLRHQGNKSLDRDGITAARIRDQRVSQEAHRA